MEKYIEETYDKSVKSELKMKILLELKHIFFAKEKENKQLEELLPKHLRPNLYY